MRSSRRLWPWLPLPALLLLLELQLLWQNPQVLWIWVPTGTRHLQRCGSVGGWIILTRGDL